MASEDIARLNIRLEATTAKLERALDRARSQMRRTSGDMERQARRVDSRLSKVGSSFGRGLPPQATAAVAALTSVATAIGFVIAEGDRLKLLEGRFKALTGSADRAGALMQGVFDIVSETGVSIESTGQALSRFRIAADDIGATDDQVIQLTENIQKLGVIGGGTTQEITAGSIQLGQALASGVLRGDELRSVMENLPLVARAIADGLGVGVGELREMGKEGRLASREVFAAILSQSEQINAQFSEVPETVGRAFGKFKGELSQTLSLIDQMSGASETLAGFINQAAAGLRSVRSGLEDISAAASESDSARFLPLWMKGPLMMASSLRQSGQEAAAEEGAPAVDALTSEGAVALPLSGGAKKSGGARKADPELKAAESFRELSKAMAENASELEFQISLMGLSEAEQQRLTAAREHNSRMIDVYSEAVNAVNLITDEELSQVEALSREIETLTIKRMEAAEAIKAQQAAAEAANRTMGDFANSLGSAIGQAQSFDQAMKNLAITLLQEGLRGILTGEGVFGGLKIGGFATGGVPPVGKPSVVGERGPEIFVPSVRGRVMSATDTRNALKGGGGDGTVIHMNFAPGVDAAAIAAIRNQILPEVPAIAVAAVGQARRSGGGVARSLR